MIVVSIEGIQNLGGVLSYYLATHRFESEGVLIKTTGVYISKAIYAVGRDSNG